MDLLKCDKCGNRNIMCCVCEKNKHYRETDFSHDVYIKNKAIDEFVRRLKNHPYAQYHLDSYLKESISEIAEQMKAGADNE